MKIIDSHVHIGKKEFCTNPNSDFLYNLCADYDEIINLMNKNKIDKSIIFPIPHKDFDVKLSNEYVLEAYKKFPNRFIPFCRIDRNLDKNLSENGFKGVKLHLVYEDVDDSLLKKSLKIIEEYRVPIVIHARFKDKVKQLVKIMSLAPTIKIILAHMGRGHIYTGDQVVENALELRKYPNLYMDTSTVGDIKSIINCCEIIGYNRVVYGSDYPFGINIFADYEYSSDISNLEQALSFENKQKIFNQNIDAMLHNKKVSFDVQVRYSTVNDYEKIVDLIEQMSQRDVMYLALRQKLALIRRIAKTGRHFIVAEYNHEIVGFLRESGRPDNFSLIEEVVVSPCCRNIGVCKKMLDFQHSIFKKTLAKTNKSNTVMNHIFEEYGYKLENPDAQRILNWVRVVQ